MLSAQHIHDRVRTALGDNIITQAQLEGLHPWLAVSAENWPKVAAFLKNDGELQFGWLRCITGLDYPDKKQIAAAYDLMSPKYRHEICVKVFVPREKPEIPSIASVWAAADWHERETYDLLGINFTGHPDSVETNGVTHPRRILLPDDWIGFPLRKDYVFPKEYEGIPGTVEMDWAQKPNYPK